MRFQARQREDAGCIGAVGRALLVWLLVCGAPPVQGQSSSIPQGGATAENRAPLPGPPMFDPRRYTEDYRYLHDPAKRTGAWWEALKRVELEPSRPSTRETGTPVLRIGNEVRVRTENYTGNLFSTDRVGRQGYVWERVLPYLEVDANPSVRFVLQFEAAYSQEQNPGPSPLDKTSADFLQGFVEVARSTPIGHFAVRAGRQVLSYGDGSLIDSRYGPNVLLAFDGAVLNSQRGAWRVDTFYARPVNSNLQDFDDATSAEQQVWGVFTGRNLPGLKRGELDLEYVGFRDTTAIFNGKQGAELRHTLGVRHVGSLGNLDWKGELLGQFGTFGAGRIAAGAAAGEMGVTGSGWFFKPRLHLNSGLASGDRDGHSADLHTFNALFPRGQYFSDTGLIGPYNVVNAREGVLLNLGKTLTIDTLAGEYWRESEDDGVYRNGGGVLYPASRGRGKYVATQVESVADFEPVHGVACRLTLAHFAPGAFVRSTPHHRSVWFVGAETRWWF